MRRVMVIFAVAALVGGALVGGATVALVLWVME